MLKDSALVSNDIFPFNTAQNNHAGTKITSYCFPVYEGVSLLDLAGPLEGFRVADFLRQASAVRSIVHARSCLREVEIIEESLCSREVFFACAQLCRFGRTTPHPLGLALGKFRAHD
jgi:hypothetical protein